jgi:hypothetical protein
MGDQFPIGRNEGLFGLDLRDDLMLSGVLFA